MEGDGFLLPRALGATGRGAEVPGKDRAGMMCYFEPGNTVDVRDEASSQWPRIEPGPVHVARLHDEEIQRNSEKTSRKSVVPDFREG